MLKSVSALSIDACVLTLTFVEFHDISISMLMIFKISFAQLRKVINLFAVSLKHFHYNDAQHQQREKLYSFYVRNAVNRNSEIKYVIIEFSTRFKFSDAHYERIFQKAHFESKCNQN